MLLNWEFSQAKGGRQAQGGSFGISGRLLLFHYRIRVRVRMFLGSHLKPANWNPTLTFHRQYSIMSPPTPLPVPDPRLGSKLSSFGYDEVVSQLESFYDFLPHIPATAVHKAPEGGWPSITPETLGGHLNQKSVEVIELLRRLPYIDGIGRRGGFRTDAHPWIANEAYPCDYRVLVQSNTGELSDRDTPGWVFNVRDDCGFATRPDYGDGDGDDEQEQQGAVEERWPPWVMQLTTGTDREGSCWMLDTSDGTVTRYCVMKSVYPPTYPEDDPRAWRDRLCDLDTRPLADFLFQLRQEYRDMTCIGLPDVDTGGAYPSLYFRNEGDGPGSYQWKETEVSWDPTIVGYFVDTRQRVEMEINTRSTILTELSGTAENLWREWLAG